MKADIKKKLTDTGFPTHSTFYQVAHRMADKVEKNSYPSGYQAMKKVDERLPAHQLAGKNLKSGKIEVSEKVPAQYRKEVALHEEVESKNLKKRGAR